MNYATAPVATPGGGAAPPICRNCSTSTTPLWRRDEGGAVLCNACGLFLKLHGRPRPISLKTDVIKSRNRVKNSASKPKRKNSSDPVDIPANDLELHRPSQKSRRLSVRGSIDELDHLGEAPLVSADGLPDPFLSTPRAGTVVLESQPLHHRMASHPHDGARLHYPGHAGHSRPYSHSYSSHQSPYASHHPFEHHPAYSSAGPSASQSEMTMTSSSSPYEALLASNNSLKTRVNELEVINDLFRGRVAELEQVERDARRDALEARENEKVVRFQLNDALALVAGLRRQLDRRASLSGSVVSVPHSSASGETTAQQQQQQQHQKVPNGKHVSAMESIPAPAAKSVSRISDLVNSPSGSPPSHHIFPPMSKRESISGSAALPPLSEHPSKPKPEYRRPSTSHSGLEPFPPLPPLHALPPPPPPPQPPASTVLSSGSFPPVPPHHSISDVRTLPDAGNGHPASFHGGLPASVLTDMAGPNPGQLKTRSRPTSPFEQPRSMSGPAIRGVRDAPPKSPVSQYRTHGPGNGDVPVPVPYHFRDSDLPPVAALGHRPPIVVAKPCGTSQISPRMDAT